MQVILALLTFFFFLFGDNLSFLSQSTGRTSPAASAVEEVDEEEFLFGPELHPLSDSENVPWWDGEIHPAVDPPGPGLHDL